MEPEAAARQVSEHMSGTSFKEKLSFGFSLFLPAWRSFLPDGIYTVCWVSPVGQVTLPKPQGITVCANAWRKLARGTLPAGASIIGQRGQRWAQAARRSPSELSSGQHRWQVIKSRDVQWRVLWKPRKGQALAMLVARS